MFTEDSVSARRLKSGLKPVFLTLEKDMEFAENAIKSFNHCVGKKLSEVVLLATSSVAKKKPIVGLVHTLFIIQDFEVDRDKKKLSSLEVARTATRLRANKRYDTAEHLRNAVAKHYELPLEQLDAILAEETEPRVYARTAVSPEALIAIYNFEYWNLLHKLASSPFKSSWFDRKLSPADDYKKSDRLEWSGKKVAFSFGQWLTEMETTSDAVTKLYPQYLPTNLQTS